MYVFLLHGFLVNGMLHYRWLEPFDSAFGRVMLVVLGIAVTCMLSSAWVRRSFGWIVEPNVQFLFKKRIRRKAKEAQKRGVLAPLS